MFKSGDPVAFMNPVSKGHPELGLKVELGRVMRVGPTDLSIASVFNAFPEEQKLDGVMRWLVPISECWKVEKPA